MAQVARPDHDKVARRAKNRIHQQREDRRIQAHHRLEADQFRIRDRRRQRYRRYRYAGHRIMPQPFPPISNKFRSPGVTRRTEGIFLRVMDDFSIYHHGKLAAATSSRSVGNSSASPGSGSFTSAKRWRDRFAFE